LEVSGIQISGSVHRAINHNSEWSVCNDASITLDSLEPVKPPRPKKLARYDGIYIYKLTSWLSATLLEIGQLF